MEGLGNMAGKGRCLDDVLYVVEGDGGGSKGKVANYIKGRRICVLTC